MWGLAALVVLAATVGTTHGARAVDHAARKNGRVASCNPECIADKSEYQEDIDELLNERSGWGHDAKGGKDGDVYVVNSTDDSECSLKEAVECSDELWIVFDQKLDGKVIRSNKRFRVKSYKTVDGRGRNITIQSPVETSDEECDYERIFEIRSQKHVIINDVFMDGLFRDWENGGECADAIFMDESEHIWIHHNRFEYWMDLAVQMKPKDDGTLNKKVSVTSNYFRHIKQGLVFYADEVTLSRNVFDGIRARTPKVMDGQTHCYNNVFTNWSVTQTGNGGIIYSQANMFDPYEGKSIANGIVFCSDNYGKDNGEWKPIFMNDCSAGSGTNSSFKDDSEKLGDVKKCSSNSCVQDLYDDVFEEAGPRTDHVSPAPSPGLPSGEIALRSIRSGRYLHVPEDSNNGDAVQQRASNSDGIRDGSWWIVTNAGSGVMLKNKRSGRYLHVKSEARNNGDQVYEETSTSDGSVWIVEQAAGGAVMLKSLRSGYRIHVTEENTGYKEPVFQKPSTSEGSQWEIVQ